MLSAQRKAVRKFALARVHLRIQNLSAQTLWFQAKIFQTRILFRDDTNVQNEQKECQK